MTLAGLNTVNLSTLNTFNQVHLFLLIIFGSAIFVSAVVVWARRRSFEKKLISFSEAQRKEDKRGRSGSRGRRRTWSGLVRSRPRDEELYVGENVDRDDFAIIEEEKISSAQDRSLTPPARRGAPEMNGISSNTGLLLERERGSTMLSSSNVHFPPDTVFEHRRDALSPVSILPRRRNFFHAQGVGARPSASLHTMSPAPPSIAPTEMPVRPSNHGIKARYFDSVNGWTGRNSQFHGLDAEERERLGGKSILRDMSFRLNTANI